MPRAPSVSPDRGYLLRRVGGGARLISAPMAGRQSAAVAFMFSVGSRHEERPIAGLSHFIEHIVFKGGERFPTARAISEAVEAVGGSINASTDKEATVFYAKVPAEHLDLACSVLADMLFSPRLEPAEVIKERQVVIEELRMSLDNPQDHVGTLFDEVMYPDQPLGWDVAGTEETVAGFDAEGCRRHLSRNYVPGRLVVSIAGGVDHEAALAGVEGRLGDGSPGGAAADAEAATPSPADERSAGMVRLLARRTEQANVILGGHAFSYHDPRRFALDLLNVVLGEGMASRLFQELREERALVYDVHSFTSKLRDTGCLGVYLGCEPRQASRAVSVVVDELLTLATRPVPADELARAKEYSKGRLRLHLEGTGATCQYLGQQELLTGEILVPHEVVAAIESVTAEEIRAVAEVVCRHGLRAALIGPFSRVERFERALARAS